MSKIARRNLDFDGLMDVIEKESDKIGSIAISWVSEYGLNIPKASIIKYLTTEPGSIRYTRWRDIPDGKEYAEHITDCRKYIEECLIALDSMMTRLPYAKAKWVEDGSGVIRPLKSTAVKWYRKSISRSIFKSPISMSYWNALPDDEAHIFDSDDYRQFCRHAKRIKAFYERLLTHESLKQERGSGRFKWVGYEKALAAKGAYQFLYECYGEKASVYSGVEGKRPSAYCKLYQIIIGLLGHTLESNPIPKLREGIEMRDSELTYLRNKMTEGSFEERMVQRDEERRKIFK